MPKIKTEIGREVTNGRVVIRYDDGTEKILAIPTAPRDGLVADKEKSEGEGHKFTQKELKTRGYND